MRGGDGGTQMAVRVRIWARSGARWLLMAAAAIGMATSCAGCIWLAIPSLAYQGYKYEHGGGSQTTSSQQSTSKSSKSSNTAAAVTPNSSNTE
jgi:hypothetical protein